MNKEQWREQLDMPPDKAKLSRTDRGELRSLLTSQVFIRAAQIVTQERRGYENALLGANLGDPKEVAAASKSQGKALGIDRAFEALADLTEGE